MPVLSVVILCYKSGDEIIPFVERVKGVVQQITEDYELVLVGNYHEGDVVDLTPKIVRDLAASDSRIVAVTKVKEGMMAWDARSGLDAASGGLVSLIDGDNQMPPEDLLGVYSNLVDNQCDMAMTYRVKRGDGIGRQVNSWCYNLLFNLMFPGSFVRDINSKPKIFTRDFLSKLRLNSTDWFLDAEIIIQARRHNATIGQIPTVFYRSESRKSFVRFGAVLEFVRNLVKYRCLEFFVRK